MKTAGEALTERILEDLKSEGLVPDSRETELLARAAWASDRLAELEKMIAKHGSTFYDEKAKMVKPSPMLPEARHLTLVIARCLTGIQMEAKTEKGVDPVKSRAGKASWAARQERARG